jgi:hypothetical protein
MDQNTNNSAESNQPPKALAEGLISAIRDGTHRAQATAERALPAVKSAAGEAVYWTAFGVTFAAVFSWVLAREITPDSVKTRFQDGLKAGKGSAEDYARRMAARRAPRQVALLGPPKTDAEPGMV